MKPVGVEELRVPGPNAVALGTFDGVHLGHKALVQQLLSKAQEIHGRAIVLTFDRHPSEVVAPEKSPLYITTLSRKVELLREAGAERVIVLSFDKQVASLTAEEFAQRVLAEGLDARAMVVGPNFRFGTGRTGSIVKLETLGRELGFEVTAAPAVELQGAMVSSTRIRSLIIRGCVKEAADLLGRLFELPGQVESGVGIGRTLGFPTANLVPPDRHIIPGNGIYAARVRIGEQLLPAAVNIGERPTLGAGRILVEAHILDFNGDLYGCDITLLFVDRLRDELKFESKEALAEQIRRDVENVRNMLSPK